MIRVKISCLALRRKIASLAFLFASGFFLANSLGLAFAAQREHRLFKSLVDAENGVPYEHSPNKPPATESLPAFRGYGFPVRMMNVVHVLLSERGRVFSGRDYPIRESFYTSGSDHLTTGQGACASFSWVLAEALQTAGYTANLAKLRCKDGSLCHTIVEVEDRGRSVVLDPVQNLFYLNNEGEPATLEEISQEGAVPFNESISTTILDIRNLQTKQSQVVYTNWERIPLVGDALGSVLASSGPAFSRFSLRSRFLNTHQSLSVVSFLFALVFFLSFLVANRCALAQSSLRE